MLTSRDYTGVFKDVQFKTGNRHFLLLATPNGYDGPGHGRIGLIIAKRHVKRAVDRNRIKRQIRESFRHRRSELPSLDIVVLARPGIASLDSSEAYRQLDKLWRKLTKQAESR